MLPIRFFALLLTPALGALACSNPELATVPDGSVPEQQEAAVDAPPEASEASAQDALADTSDEAADAPSDAPVDDAAADAVPDATCTLAGPYSSTNPVCNACAEQECCVEINDCLLDPACNDSYVNCILACSFGLDAGEVPLCVAECGVQYPAGKAKYDTAIGCADSRCDAECNGQQAFKP